MKKKLSTLIVKIGLLAVLALSFPLAQSPASYCFAFSDQEPPIQDDSKGKSKQGPDKKEKKDVKKDEAQGPVDTIVFLIYWLLGQ